ncbi:hypothetical protein E1A91_A08G192800v1 [Gossypium mustelinum]|uniref:Uncharacterized protein n=1 Tax=Gossypium mustelinum TaxID=34275 RepID=A0A5D2YC87_GOSMU|nr:hypothetical protein E1A91_A08G192800v1 [Gossypium mustelinum]
MWESKYSFLFNLEGKTFSLKKIPKITRIFLQTNGTKEEILDKITY